MPHVGCWQSGAPTGQLAPDPGLALGTLPAPCPEPGLCDAGAVLIAYQAGPLAPLFAVAPSQPHVTGSTKQSVPAQPCPLPPLPVSSRTDPCRQGQDCAYCGPRLSIRIHRANEEREREQCSLISLRVAAASYA